MAMGLLWYWKSNQMESDSKLKCEQIDSELNLIGMYQRGIPNQSKIRNSTEVKLESSTIHVEAIGLLLYCYLSVFCILVLLLFY